MELQDSIGNLGSFGLIALGIVVCEALAVAVQPLVLFFSGTIRRGPVRPEVALTIDDGPDPVSTPRWLEALAAAGIKATFFCPGRSLEARPDLVQAILRAGHELGNHSYSHPWNLAFFSPKRARGELDRAQRAIARLTAAGRFFRPVAGVMSPPLAAAARSLGLTPVTWTARAFDGGPVPVRPQAALRRLGRGLCAGGILALHDNPRSPGPEIVRELRARADRAGLRFVTLSTLLRSERAHLPRTEVERSRGVRATG
jgi:peptidoglycan-N-acetylglucosamine deacetylase